MVAPTPETNETREIDDARLKNEAAFHDRTFALGARRAADKFYRVAGSSSAMYESLVLHYARNATALEYGCGMGSLAFDMARSGGTAVGIDISPYAIESAREEAKHAGLENRAAFHVMNAERLTFPDESFDIVCGSGILHHLNLSKAYQEIARVLKPGGRGIFYEPMGHNSLINLYRRRTPSLRTADEHPLLRRDIEAAGSHFKSVRASYFHLLAIASAFLPSALNKFYSPVAEALDKLLLHPRSPLRYQAWIVVLQFER